MLTGEMMMILMKSSGHDEARYTRLRLIYNDEVWAVDRRDVRLVPVLDVCYLST